MELVFSKEDLFVIAQQVAEILKEDQKANAPAELDKYTHTYSAKEVAKIVNKTPQIIRKHLTLGLLEGTKTAKDWIITQESLNKYIGKNE